MKKLLLIISLTINILASEVLGKDIIEDYNEVTYVCKDNLVIAELKIENIVREIPVVWEQNSTVVKLECKDFQNWVK
jgi:hypothetical protein